VSHVALVLAVGRHVLLSPVVGLGVCLWTSGAARAVAASALRRILIYILTDDMVELLMLKSGRSCGLGEFLSIVVRQTNLGRLFTQGARRAWTGERDFWVNERVREPVHC
jgi:hypothetical protein